MIKIKYKDTQYEQQKIKKYSDIKIQTHTHTIAKYKELLQSKINLSIIFNEVFVFQDKLN